MKASLKKRENINLPSIIIDNSISYICMTEFYFFMGDFFQSFFKLLKRVGVIPNIIFIIISFILLFFWLSKILEFGQDDKKYK